jgi:hypothetical protein
VAFRLKSWVYWFEGNYVGARECLEKALAAYGPGWNGTLCDFEDIPAVTMCILPLVLWALGALTGFSKGPELPEVEEAELLLASVAGTGNRPIR